MISALSAKSVLPSALAANGLSTAKSKIVEADLATAIKSAGSGSASIIAPVRAALNERMAADVASGKLSQKDADAVNKTLDGMDPASGGASSQGAAGTTAAEPAAQSSTDGESEAKGGGGGGGGGGAASKTELSRSTVVSGSLETITITYTDGSTTTETEAVTGATVTKPGSDTAKVGANDKAYAERIEPGSIVDKTA